MYRVIEPIPTPAFWGVGKRGRGTVVEHVSQLRRLIEVVDPVLLTTDDRLALLNLVERCFQTAGGGPGFRSLVDGAAAQLVE